MRNRASVLMLVGGLIVGSCGGGESTETTPPDVTATTSSLAKTVPTASLSTTTTTAAALPETTTTLSPSLTTTSVAATTTTTIEVAAPEPPSSLLNMTKDEIAAAATPVLEAALTVSQALELRDRELLKSVLVTNAYVIDPVLPSLRPQIDTWFSIFLNLCSRVSSGDIYVNTNGSTTAWDCFGFYDGLVDDPPDSSGSMRQIWMEGELATRFINRIDAETLKAYPGETSDKIGFFSSQEAVILDQAQTALRFVDDFQRAWEAVDVARMVDLYAADGVRNDPFGGLSEDRGEMIAWFDAISLDYSEITVDIESVQASGLGPSAAYRLTLSDGSESCEMRMASVWDLDSDGLIVQEFVFYHPDTILDCGWEMPTE